MVRRIGMPGDLRLQLARALRLAGEGSGGASRSTSEMSLGDRAEWRHELPTEPLGRPRKTVPWIGTLQGYLRRKPGRALPLAGGEIEVVPIV